MDVILVNLLPFVLIMGAMYFLMIRPQKKQQEKKQSMLDAMQPGNHVVTIGGLHGVVDEVNKAQRTVVLDCEGVYLTFEISAISTVKEGVATATPVETETEAEAIEDEYEEYDDYDEANEVEGEYTEEDFDDEKEYAHHNS
ncbi:preprotein translocase subunit YajC [Fundicoccus culcitae]|uniref:Preprotein translocase subunit YajC n=1 Tax=Fundicoccus culcitae TaxID=2969821 RepID=A0ABY5P7X8_9LACT|nr:preprotein translocase subunit YajC [Fundicoccus culcitae]UUX34595.1 preprotein translocase subunit YajC [Fundicoccus culcitae]